MLAGCDVDRAHDFEVPESSANATFHAVLEARVATMSLPNHAMCSLSFVPLILLWMPSAVAAFISNS